MKGAKKQILTAAEVESAKLVWVRWIQREIVSELEDSAAVMKSQRRPEVDGTDIPSNREEGDEKGMQDQDAANNLAVDCSRDKKARTGKFRLLAPWKDQEGVWRVGGRNRLTVPFTADGKPAILLPEGSKYTYLAMLAAHNKAHPGVQ